MATEVQEMYCPECNEDLTLGVEGEEKRLVVLCGCKDAQTLKSFVAMYYNDAEVDNEDGEKGGGGVGGRMFQ